MIAASSLENNFYTWDGSLKIPKYRTGDFSPASIATSERAFERVGANRLPRAINSVDDFLSPLSRGFPLASSLGLRLCGGVFVRDLKTLTK